MKRWEKTSTLRCVWYVGKNVFLENLLINLRPTPLSFGLQDRLQMEVFITHTDSDRVVIKQFLYTLMGVNPFYVTSEF